MASSPVSEQQASSLCPEGKPPFSLPPHTPRLVKRKGQRDGCSLQKGRGGGVVHTSAQAGRQAAEQFWQSEGLQECGGL